MADDPEKDRFVTMLPPMDLPGAGKALQVDTTAVRENALNRLVDVSGDEGLRTLFRDSPIERIEKLIRSYEQAKADVARHGYFGARWLASEFEIEDEPPKGDE